MAGQTEAVEHPDDLRRLVADAVTADSAEARWSAVAAVPPSLVEALLHAGMQGGNDLELLGTGVAASPGAASGILCLTAEAVLDAEDRGEPAVLVRDETTPADEIGMQLAEGIVTARGGMASHAAVVARGWGVPAVVGLTDLIVSGDHVTVGGRLIEEGSPISLDGTTGEVFAGAAGVAAAAAEVPELDVLLGWADEVRGDRVGVRGNADRADDAIRARAFGAEGIGLCRTEHMFLGDRLPVIRRFLLATDTDEEAAALEELGAVQRIDLAAVLEAMAPLPVTVRLLDAPLHEFLGGDSPLGAEHNPMLGERGIRLAVMREGLYRMQTRALLAAMADLRESGAHPHAAVMLPLVATAAELELVRGWVLDEITAVDPVDPPMVGTMIETPRAALLAGEMARHADFFSFGTNDLTQMVFGFSRDDVEQRIMGEYLSRGLLPANPFQELDPGAVAPLVAAATRAGRLAHPGLEVGVCGEHGGDPASISLLVAAGVDYVSCSPFRVPVARLAVAQALIALDA